MKQNLYCATGWVWSAFFPCTAVYHCNFTYCSLAKKSYFCSDYAVYVVLCLLELECLRGIVLLCRVVPCTLSVYSIFVSLTVLRGVITYRFLRQIYYQMFDVSLHTQLNTFLKCGFTIALLISVVTVLDELCFVPQCGCFLLQKQRNKY